MRKKILSILIATLMLVQMFGFSSLVYADGPPATNWQDPGVVGTAYAGGTGAVDDPYKISDGAELAFLAKEVNSGEDYEGIYFALTDDISLAAHMWTPIGAPAHPFEGHFNGRGHTVSGLIAIGGSYEGLFGYIGSEGYVERVALDNPYVAATGMGTDYAGGIAGGNLGTIKNCSVRGTNPIQSVMGGFVGGIAGHNEGTIQYCVVDASAVAAGDYCVGGIAGDSYNISGTVTDCLVLQAPSLGSPADNLVGAIVGKLWGGSSVSNCHYGDNLATVNSTPDTLIYAVGGTTEDTNDNSYLDPESYTGDKTTYEYDDNFFLDTLGDHSEGAPYYWSDPWSIGGADSIWTTDGGDVSICLQPVNEDSGAETWLDHAAVDFDGGSGEPYGDGESPYEINTAEQLAYLAGQVLSGTDYDSTYFELTADIDLGAYEWVPIGDMDNNFSGYFDGNGYTISNMRIGTALAPNDSLAYAGLFGNTDEDSDIYNVTLTGASIYSTYAETATLDGNYIGLLVGYAQGEVDDCHVSGTIACGNAYNSSIYAGGLVGYFNGEEENTYIQDSTAAVAVSALDGDSGTALGGFVGYHDGGAVYDCASAGDVNIGTMYDWAFGCAGGFVGLAYGPIWNCYATGDVTGVDSVYVGGFVGLIQWSGEIDNCYARGNVEGNTEARAGGFVGYAEDGTIQNCYATGSVEGSTDSDVGGFNGDYDSTIILDCYFNNQNGTTESEEATSMAAIDMQNDAFAYTLNGNREDIEPQNEYWADYMEFSGWTRDDGTNDGYPYYSGAPQNVTAKADDGQVTINWDAVEEAEGYKLYVGIRTGVYSQIFEIDSDSNSYTVEDLINDTTYYFAISAVNDSGESDKSVEVKATTFHVAVLEDTTTRKAIATDNITVIVNSNGSYQLQLNPGVSGLYPNEGYQGAYFLFNKDGTTFKQFSELSSTISDFQLSGNAISLKVTDSVNKLEHTVSWEIIGSTSSNSGGYMKLSVASKNTDTIAHDLGTYMYWDTQINNNDASPFTVIANGWTNYSGNFQISGYFRNEDGATAADAIFMGAYSNPGGITWTRETRMAWAQQEAAIGTTINAADTAASVWYDPASVEAGESRTVSCVFAVNSQTERINPIIAQPGTVNQSTALQIGVDPEDGASFKYKIFSAIPSIPALNTTASSITGLADLVEGADITGVDATTNKYLGIYEVGADGNIKRFAAKKLFENEIKIITASSGGGGGAQPSQGTVIVIVNGEQQNAGTETRSTEAGKSVVTVAVDNKVIESRIDEAIKKNTTGNGNVVQVPVADTKSEVVKVELTGDIVKKLETNTFDVSIKRDNVEYVIPAEEFTISKVAENLGVQEKDLGNIKIEVKITKLDETVVAKYNEVAKSNGAELVFPPVEFEIVAKTTKADGTTGEVGISKFSNYVERVMEIPAGVDPSKITTGIVFNPDGTYSHVPTDVFQKDGKWYAKLNSLTNSDYSVIWNPITVKSVENHWAKNAVNDMASRLVIFDPEKFEPNKAITRADFAEYIVRALGLYREGSGHENKFKDVSASGDRTLAILIANEYGVITGYPDGTFKPDQKITREEAMAMYQRAMKVTKLTGSDTARYEKYADFSKVSGWAQAVVKEVLSAHVFNGTSATTISPKSNLTYAESAQAIKNLLVESKLINE